MGGEALVIRSTHVWRALALSVALAIGWPDAGFAQAGRSEANEGNRLYAEGRYGEAHERYLEALREAPDSPIIRFNDGNALYQGAEFESALEAYRDAIESGDSDLISDAWYNIGNVLYRRQMLQESLEAFKQSLRLDPTDTDAKHNLERVLEQMQQDEQDQDQNEDEQDQDQNDDEQDQNEDEQDQDQNEDEQNQDQNEHEQDQNQDQGQSPPGGQPEMSRDEAERLLDAIEEDQDEVDRQPRAAARGRRPRKDW
jgi:tetratricopeptide (TPR) repeat protein